MALDFEKMAQIRAAADRACTRRSFLTGGLKVAAGVALGGVAGAGLAGCGSDGTATTTSAGGSGATQAGADATLGPISEIGLSLTEDPRILTAAEEALGFKVNGRADGLGNQLTFWLQNYKQFDINQVNFSQNGALAATLRPIAVADIPAWNDQVIDLFRTPGVPGYSDKSGWPIAGTYTSQAVQSEKYDEFIGVPTWFGFDAFGYVVDKTAGDVTSYGAIFDPGNKGKSTLLNEPITSVMKIATYLQGTNQYSFTGALNNLTPEDLDICFQFLGEHKAKGQFRLFWSDFGQLVGLLTAGEIVVGDFWASACAAANKAGANVRFVNDPAEGSNGWIQGATISAETKNYEAATKFINWYLESGIPGSILGVQGYYSPRPDTCKPILEAQSTTVDGINDWDYWYQGAKPEERPSLDERLPHVADWQSYPDEYERYAGLWTQFVAS